MTDRSKLDILIGVLLILLIGMCCLFGQEGTLKLHGNMEWTTALRQGCDLEGQIVGAAVSAPNISFYVCTRQPNGQLQWQIANLQNPLN